MCWGFMTTLIDMMHASKPQPPVQARHGGGPELAREQMDIYKIKSFNYVPMATRRPLSVRTRRVLERSSKSDCIRVFTYTGSLKMAVVCVTGCYLGRSTDTSPRGRPHSSLSGSPVSPAMGWSDEWSPRSPTSATSTVSG